MKYAFLAFVLLASPAYAVDLSIDLSAKILTADGQTKKECVETDAEKPTVCKVLRDLTIGIVAMEALSAPDSSIKGDAAAKNGALAIELADKDSIVLTFDKATQIKTQVGKFFDPVTVARVWAALEPNK